MAPITNLLNLIESTSSHLESFDTFISKVSPIFLSSNEKRQLIDKKQLVYDFVDLLPHDIKSNYPNEKKWMSASLALSLSHNLQSNLFEHVLNEHEKFRAEASLVLETSVNKYIQNQVRQAYDADHVLLASKTLANFEAHLKTTQHLSESFITSLNPDIVDTVTKDSLNAKFSSINQFIQLLPNELRRSVSFGKHVAEFSVKISNLLNEINQFVSYQHTSFNSERIFVYQGHFAKLSAILSLINNAAYVANLKSVHIHLTNSLLIDADFRISPDRYSTHSPDLVIVSSKVKFIQANTIDLSCYVYVGYPNGQVKASNGHGHGASGHDGLPGLPGYNGGQFVILAEEIVDSSNLMFKSRGGNGGPGQNGNIERFYITLGVEISFFNGPVKYVT